MPFVVVSLLDINRQWFKSKFGFDAVETPRDTAFCSYTILEQSPRIMVVEDAAQDSRFKDSPIVLGPPYIRFYAGASLMLENIKVGTICIMDTKPRTDFLMTDRTTLLEIAEMVTLLLIERRKKSLEQHFDAQWLNQSLLTLLRGPFEQLQEHGAMVTGMYRNLCGEPPSKSYFLTGSLVERVQKFDNGLQAFREDVKFTRGYHRLCEEVLVRAMRSHAEDFTPFAPREWTDYRLEEHLIHFQIKPKFDWIMGAFSSMGQLFSHQDIMLVAVSAMLRILTVNDNQVTSLSGRVHLDNKLSSTPSAQKQFVENSKNKELWRAGFIAIDISYRSTNNGNDAKTLSFWQEGPELVAVHTLLSWVSGTLLSSVYNGGRNPYSLYRIKLPCAALISSFQVHDEAVETRLTSTTMSPYSSNSLSKDNIEVEPKPPAWSKLATEVGRVISNTIGVMSPSSRVVGSIMLPNSGKLSRVKPIE